MKTLRLQAILSLIMLFVLSSCNRVNTRHLQEMNSKSIIDSAIHLIKQKTNLKKHIKRDNTPLFEDSSTGIVHTICSFNYYYTKTWDQNSNIVVLEKGEKKITFVGTQHLVSLFNNEQANRYKKFENKVIQAMSTCDLFTMETHSEKQMSSFREKLPTAMKNLEDHNKHYSFILSRLQKNYITTTNCNSTISAMEFVLRLDHPIFKLLAHIQSTVKATESIIQEGGLLEEERATHARSIKLLQEIIQKLLKEKKDLVDENPKDLVQQLKEKNKFINISTVKIKKHQADRQKKQKQLIKLSQHKSLSELEKYQFQLKQVIKTYQSLSDEFIKMYSELKVCVNPDFYAKVIPIIQDAPYWPVSIDNMIYKAAKIYGLIKPQDTFLDFTTKEQTEYKVYYDHIPSKFLKAAVDEVDMCSKNHCVEFTNGFLSENLLKDAKIKSEFSIFPEFCKLEKKSIERNIKWVESIKELLEGNKKHLFVGVGRNHLPHLISHFILLEGWKVVQQHKV